MLETLRPSFRWCQVGFVSGTLLGLVLLGLSTVTWLETVVLAPVFGVVGMSAGFVLATFVHSLRAGNLNRIGRSALWAAGSAILVAPCLYLLGISISGSLSTDLLIGPFLWAFAGAYFTAVEVWIPSWRKRGHG